MPESTPKLGLKKPLANETVSRAAHNENLDLIDANAASQADFGAHKTAAELDHPDGSVSDAKIGNRLIDDTVAASNEADTPTGLFSKLANMIKRITGKSNWWTAPATTLEAANTHMNATTGVHGATSAATANTVVQRDINGRFKAAAPSAADDVARKSETDAALTAANNASGAATIVQTNLTTHANATTGVHGATSAAAASTLVQRDSGGRFKAATPSASDDVARKSETDAALAAANSASGAATTVQTNLTTHVNATTGVHGATSAATASTLVQRDSSGRFKAAAPSAADDVARKAEVDATVLLDGSRSMTGKLTVTGSGGVTVNDYSTTSATTGGIVLHGHNCYLENSTGLYKYKSTHPNMGARGLVFRWGSGNGVVPYWFDMGEVATTADQTFTPTLVQIGLRDENGWFTAARLQSTIPTGTAPLVVASTTMVPNLNASLVNGYSFNQDLQTTAGPSFSNINVTGTGLFLQTPNGERTIRWSFDENNASYFYGRSSDKNIGMFNINAGTSKGVWNYDPASNAFTFSAQVILNTAPTASNHATTKHYVDQQVALARTYA